LIFKTLLIFRDLCKGSDLEGKGAGVLISFAFRIWQKTKDMLTVFNGDPGKILALSIRKLHL
jgi:hypothetical protein